MKTTTKISLGLASALVFAAMNAYAWGFDKDDKKNEKQRDDASILNEAKSKIGSSTKVTTTSAPYVVVSVKEGKLKIYGIVKTKEDKKSIEKAVKEIEGTRDVDSEIAVIED